MPELTMRMAELPEIKDINGIRSRVRVVQTKEWEMLYCSFRIETALQPIRSLTKAEWIISCRQNGNKGFRIFSKAFSNFICLKYNKQNQKKPKDKAFNKAKNVVYL